FRTIRSLGVSENSVSQRNSSSPSSPPLESCTRGHFVLASRVTFVASARQRLSVPPMRGGARLAPSVCYRTAAQLLQLSSIVALPLSLTRVYFVFTRSLASSALVFLEETVSSLLFKLDFAIWEQT